MKAHIFKIIVCLYVFKVTWYAFKRIWFPYAPYFAEQSGAPMSSITATISLSNIVYILAALTVAPLLRVVNHYHLMTLCILLIAVPCIIFAVVPLSFGLFVVCVVASYISIGLIEPLWLTFITLAIPRDDQGKVCGTVETAWGFVSLIVLPAFGFLLSVWWSLPFFFFLVLLIICAVVNWLVFRPVVSAEQQKAAEPQANNSIVKKETIFEMWYDLIANPIPRGFLICMTLTAFGQSILWITFGVWLKDYYQFSLTQVAGATSAQGIADVGGEIILAIFLWIFQPATMLVYSELFQGLFLVFHAFTVYFGLSFWVNISVWIIALIAMEMKVVSMFGLASQLATMGISSSINSVVFVVMAVGQLAGTYFGNVIYEKYTYFGCVVTTAICSMISLVFVYISMKHYKHSVIAFETKQGEDNLLEMSEDTPLLIGKKTPSPPVVSQDVETPPQRTKKP